MNKILFGLTLGLWFPVAEESVLYRAPDWAESEDVARAARSLTARCKGYGYEGIQADVVERVCSKYVRVTCESGFSPDMMAIVDRFAQLSAASVELRFPAILSDVQKEQYQPGATPSEDKAPAGARWYRHPRSDLGPTLLRDEPFVPKSEILLKYVKDKNGKVRILWEIGSLQTRLLREAERKGRLGTPHLIIDGLAVEAVPLKGMEKNEEGKVVLADRLSFVPASRVVREILMNPMPFALQPEHCGDTD